jgi:hypothetical protein
MFLFVVILVIPTTAQNGDSRLSLQNNDYRFRTIDLPTDPFGTPTQTDLQSFWINNDGVITAQYQHPRSGVCCGLTPDFLNNMHMAVRLHGDWTNIDVQGADTTAGTNANAREEVALTYRSGGGPWHSAIYDLRRRELIPFTNLPGYPGGLEAVGFNDRGRIAAYAIDATGHAHGFVGDLRHSEVFHYPDPNVTDTFAQMENNFGVVVGGYVLADGSVHAYKRWRGQFTTIDPPGSILAIALAINDEGAIVGGSMGADGRIFGFLLDDEGRFIHFRVPNSTLTVPWFIDDRGQISGTYSNSDDPLFNGVFHGFAAKPVSKDNEGARTESGRMQ